jgi:hypothetical protein
MPIEIGPRSKDNISFDEAWLYCACLFHNDRSDWRLPTADEYMNHSGVHYDSFSEGDTFDELNYVTPVRDI